MGQAVPVQKSILLLMRLSIRISPCSFGDKTEEWDSPLGTLTLTGVLFQHVRRWAK